MVTATAATSSIVATIASLYAATAASTTTTISHNASVLIALLAVILLDHQFAAIHLIAVHFLQGLLYVLRILELYDATAASLAALIEEQLDVLNGADDAAEQILQILPTVVVWNVRNVDPAIATFPATVASSDATS